jgi:hypothetical protein
LKALLPTEGEKVYFSIENITQQREQKTSVSDIFSNMKCAKELDQYRKERKKKKKQRLC